MPTYAELHISINEIKVMLGAMQKTMDDFVVIKKELVECRAEVLELREQVGSITKELKKCKREINDREQYARSWSVRVFGLNVTEEEEKKLGKDVAVMQAAYDKVFKPILVGAQSRGLITTVPEMSSLLENGHQIGKQIKDKNGVLLPRPCILRFSARYMRNMVLKNKKTFMPKPSHAEIARGVSKFSISEDLTSSNYTMLKNLIKDSRVDKVWTIDGSIRFNLQGESVVKRVFSPFLDVNTVLEQ